MSYRSRIPYALAAAVAIVPLLSVAVAALALGVEVPYLTSDLAVLAGIHPLAGVLSTMGILLWWTSASLWLFTAGVLWRRAPRDVVRFALSSGALSAYLALDDLFQIHETLAPRHLGVPQAVVYGALAVATLAYLFAFRRSILRAHPRLLLSALVLLGASAAMDLVLSAERSPFGQWDSLLEDGPKWLGIVAWCGFAVARCGGELRAALAARPAAAAALSRA